MNNLINTHDEIPVLIKALRHHTGLTQEKLAARLGVTFPTVNRWEQGRTRPSPLAIQRIKEMLASLGTSGIDFSERIDSSYRPAETEFRFPVYKKEIIYIDTWPTLEIGTD